MALENVIPCNGFKGFYGSMDYDEMTFKGTIDKALILATLLIISFIGTFQISKYLSTSFVGFSNIGVFILVFCIIANIISIPVKSYISGPILSVTLGIYLGFLSSTFHEFIFGLIFEVASCTMIVLTSFLLLHKFELLNKRKNSSSTIKLYLASIGFMLIFSFVLSLFNISTVRYIGEEKVVLLLDMVVMLVMSYTLIYSQKFIDLGVRRKFPIYMEWYGAAGIVLSVIWIYPELVEMSIRRDFIYHRGRVFDSVDKKENNETSSQEKEEKDVRDVIDDYVENSKYKVVFKALGVIVLIIFFSMSYLRQVERYNEKRESQRDILRILEKEYLEKHSESTINGIEIEE